MVDVQSKCIVEARLGSRGVVLEEKWFGGGARVHRAGFRGYRGEERKISA